MFTVKLVVDLGILSQSPFGYNTVMKKLDGRKAGSFELYSIFAHELDRKPMIGISGRYSISISKDILYPALAEIIKSEPLMGVNVFKEDEGKDHNRYFRKISTINLDQVVKFLPDESLESFMDKFYAIYLPYFDETLPLWRLFVLGDGELICGFDHGPFDGNCGTMFHERLVKLLGADLAAIDSPIVPTSELPLPQSLGDIIDIRPSFGWMIRLLYKVLIHDWIFSPSKFFWLGSPTARPFSSKTVIAKLSPHETAILLKRCKQLNLSLTSLLVICWAKTVLKLLPDEKEGTSISLGCPVNLRRYMDKEYRDAMGNWVSSFNYCINNCSKEPSQSTFIEEKARDFSRLLQNELRDFHDITSKVGILDKINVENYIRNAKRSDIAEISNLGVVSVEEGDVSLEDLTFFQASSTISPTYVLNAVSVNGGSLSMTISVALDDELKSIGKSLRALLLDTLKSV